MDKKPIGTYKCIVCGGIWDGSELYIDPSPVYRLAPGPRWTCGNLFCGANVFKISDKPKSEYLKTQSQSPTK